MGEMMNIPVVKKFIDGIRFSKVSHPSL